MDDRFTNSIFEEEWWLDTVAPGQWEEVIVKNNGEVEGRLPYYVKKKGLFKYITMPRLTPYLGPWIRSPTEAVKMSTRLSHIFNTLEQIIQMLPKRTIVAQTLHWSCANHLPFLWAGFEQMTRYTYLLPLEPSEQEIWSGLDETCRRQIRKARKLVRVRDAPDHVRLWDVLRSTYARQGTSPGSSELC